MFCFWITTVFFMLYSADLINFSDFTSTSLRVVYFNQLLGAVLCQVLYILISSSVMLVLCLIDYHDSSNPLCYGAHLSTVFL